MRTTLNIESVLGQAIPYQNGIPVPSFEPQQRSVIALNGEWLKRRLASDHELTMAERDESWHARLEAAEGEWLHGSDMSAWETHSIPLPENRLSGKAEAGAAERYEDGVWYRREFHIDALADGCSYTLKALAISYVADVWLNGSWIGCHEGGFTPFALDATPYLREGANEIRIRVDNPPWGSRKDTIPAVEGTDFFNYTGIIHDLYIERTSAVHIVRADIVPLDTEGRLRARVVIENRGADNCAVLLQGSVYETDREAPNYMASPLAASIKGAQAALEGSLATELDIPAGTARLVQFETRVLQPKLWSPAEPNVYVAEFALLRRRRREQDRATALAGDEGGSVESADADDRLATQFGNRTIRTAGASLLLNGEPVFLAGIARHEEWPEYGRTASWERIRSDMEQIKALHANMVRTGHYPNHIYTYILLDRLGLMAMSEIPLWQFETGHFEAQEERRLADQMWREMIFSQYNRPSVILWSTQNESKEVRLRLTYNERLVQDVRRLYDDGRLITQSAAADQPGPEDASMEPLDVAAWTMYFGIFHGGTYYEGTRDFLERAHQAYPNKPILNTEFGHWTGERDALEQEQLIVYKETLRALMEKGTVSLDGEYNPHGYVAGIDFWIMYDWYVNHNNWIDTFGIRHMGRRHAKQLEAQIRRDFGRITGHALRGEEYDV